MESRRAQSQIANLVGHFTYTVRDPLWKDIPLSAGFKALLGSEVVQKQSRIKRLGPVHLLYPGAVHTRLDHSLGVFHLSRLILLRLLSSKVNSPESTLNFSDEGLTAFLAAALLHDVGHFPYAHALKDIITQSHESLGAQIIEEEPSLREIIESKLNTSVEYVTQIIDDTLPCDEREILFYRRLLSGTLDPDKLDYLSRDALFCGVPYGVQDAAYIIRHLKVNRETTLYLPLEAIGGVEHLLFAKYSMYKNVYWHPKVRSATATIKKALFLALEEGSITQELLFNLDDESLYHLLEQKAPPPIYNLAQRVHNNQLLEERGSLPYNSEIHSSLFSDKLFRREAEHSLWEALRKSYPPLSPLEVVIDIPEEVSFEANLMIELEDKSLKDFSEVDPLFTPSTVALFTKSIRQIRLFLPPYISEEVAKGPFSEVVNSNG